MTYQVVGWFSERMNLAENKARVVGSGKYYYHEAISVTEAHSKGVGWISGTDYGPSRLR